MLEPDIRSTLAELGYDCPLFNNVNDFNILLKDDVDLHFVSFVNWLSLELQRVCKLEECVHKPESMEDVRSFYMELSSFLRELKCPYAVFTGGNLAKTLSNENQRLLLINYLISELQAGCMIESRIGRPAKAGGGSAVSLCAESETAAQLRIMLGCLGFAKPPPNITAKQLFDKACEKVTELISKIPKGNLGDALFTGILTEKQWRMLNTINETMTDEYKWREDVLLKRLDVTVLSFTWCDRLKKFEDKLLQLYQSARQQLKINSRIQLADLLAARSDLLEIDKTSGVSVRAKTKSKLNAIVMYGKIPDRGGRPTEIEPPPLEMPAWQQRSTGSGHFRDRGTGVAPQSQRQQGREGGRVQGGWSPSASGNGGSDWSNQRATFYPESQQSYGEYQQQGHSHDNRQPYHGQQQGAAYHQDFYRTSGQQHQQQYGGYPDQQGNDGRRGGGRGRRGYDRY